MKDGLERIKPGKKKLRLYGVAVQQEDEGRQFVCFLLGEERYGIAIDFVQEILKPRNITEVPHTSEFISGIINLRGKIVPVVDLRLRLGLAAFELSRSSRVLVVMHDAGVIGMLVDSVLEVRHIRDAQIETAPSLVTSSVDSEYFKGIANCGDGIVIILDFDRVLQKPASAVLALSPRAL